MSSCEIYPVIEELSLKGKKFCIVTEVYPNGKVKRGVVSEGKVIVGEIDPFALEGKEEVEIQGMKVKIMTDCAEGNPNVIVIGSGKVARHLVSLMNFLNYPVTVVGDHDVDDSFEANVVNDMKLLPTLINENTFVVVANEGGKHYDVSGVEMAIKGGAKFVALMASRNRAALAIKRMIDSGIKEEEIKKRFYSPAGLDLGSKTPQEIALSIASQIVAIARGGGGGHYMLKKDPYSLVGKVQEENCVWIDGKKEHEYPSQRC
jgi:xanthine dehydrogenase accessory factor